jgi:hypothetical protein
MHKFARTHVLTARSAAPSKLAESAGTEAAKASPFTDKVGGRKAAANAQAMKPAQSPPPFAKGCERPFAFATF